MILARLTLTFNLWRFQINLWRLHRMERALKAARNPKLSPQLQERVERTLAIVEKMSQVYAQAVDTIKAYRDSVRATRAARAILQSPSTPLFFEEAINEIANQYEDKVQELKAYQQQIQERTS